MKKFISIILALFTVFTSFPAFAASKDAEEMKNVLIAVKQKIEIPQNLTEFDYNIDKERQQTKYEFVWYDKEKENYIYVCCDKVGRMFQIEYSYDDFDDDLLKTFTNDEKIKCADEFLKKVAPELIEDETDRFVFDGDMAVLNEGYMGYDRIRNGARVIYDSLFLKFTTYNGSLMVTDLYVDRSDDIEFDDPDRVISNPIESYNAAYPLEMIYRDKYYGFVRNSRKDKTALVYRVKDNNAGYISAETGEAVEEDEDEWEYAMAAGSAKNESMEDASETSYLTDGEIYEIENTKNLLTEEEADKIVRNLPFVSVNRDLSLTSARLCSAGEDYYRKVSYWSTKDNGYSYINATLDATNGKLISLRNYKESKNRNKSRGQEQKGKDAIDKFLNTVASSDIEQCELSDEVVDDDSVSRHYDRLIDGIKYIEDGIDVSYKFDTKEISHYKLDFSKGKEFADKSDAISLEKAEEIWYDKIGVELVYVKVDGKLKLCYGPTMDGSELDAISGEFVQGTCVDKYEYTDIENHWARQAIEWLADCEIGFDSEKFYPDNPISQVDLLRFFGAGICNRSIPYYEVDDLYEYLSNIGVISKEEKYPDSQVTREDAFAYIIRMADLDKVARCSDIFSVNYADGNLITPGKIGYPAILTGLGVIGGNGGYLRPQQPITRGEAAVILYKFMHVN